MIDFILDRIIPSRRLKRMNENMCRVVGHNFKPDKFDMRRQCGRCNRVEALLGPMGWTKWPLDKNDKWNIS